MAHYRLQGTLLGAAGIAIDHTFIVDSDQIAIGMARDYPVHLGQGLANWACLTDANENIVWEVGQRP
jgi:hypothetical protein